MTLSAEYYSGGPAVGLTGEIATFVRTADEFQDERFDGFKFGSGAASKVTIVGDEFEELLDSKGQMTASLLSDYTADQLSYTRFWSKEQFLMLAEGPIKPPKL